MLTHSQPKSGEGAWLWLIKLVAGCLIILVITLHMIANHLVAPGGLLSYADVVKYYSHPIIPIIEAIFLILVVGHSLLGLRSIILDLNPAPKIMRFINVLLLAAGSFAVIYGIWLLIVIAGRSAG